jgi:hypothetical protein
MPIIDFPKPKEAWSKPKTLEDWPWDMELGKPYGDINGSIANPPEQEVNDLARYTDKINPDHYRQLPMEAIEITEHFNFCLGNALKYIIRCEHKGDKRSDLQKAIWYLQRELARS